MFRGCGGFPICSGRVPSLGGAPGLPQTSPEVEAGAAVGEWYWMVGWAHEAERSKEPKALLPTEGGPVAVAS